MLTLADKTVLVTGGTGSIGSAVVKRLLSRDVAEVRIFSRDENKQQDMRLLSKDNRLRFFLGDVRDEHSLADAAAGAELIFHAAAQKQVSSCEAFPFEALRTNTLGAENLLRVAVQSGASHVVMLSSDKAVYPMSTMGITKAMMEKLALAKARTAAQRTTICVARFGSIMGSRGSVVCRFLQQLQATQPLTVTDPRMTRFMMTLDDAVDLVLHAFEHGEPGDTFVAKTPAVSIGVLATAMQKVLGASTAVHITGARPHDKLHETLLTREELKAAVEVCGALRVPLRSLDPVDEPKAAVTPAAASNDGPPFADDYTSQNAKRLEVDEMCDLLLELAIVQEAVRHPRAVD